MINAEEIIEQRGITGNHTNDSLFISSTYIHLLYYYWVTGINTEMNS